jgi:hypothetical protein
MADTPVTTSLLVLETKYRNDIVSQINRMSVLARLLRVVPAETTFPQWVAASDAALAENYSEGADASNYGSDNQTQALLPWALVRSNFHITGTAQRISGLSASPASNQNQIARRMVESSSKLASRINGQLYTGTGSSQQIAGLAMAIGSVSNTYAGIDRSVSDNAYWRPYVVDPGSLTAITLATVRKDIRSIYEQSGLTPNLAVCSPGVFDALAEMFDPTRRYMQDIVQGGRGPVRLDGSARAIDIEGCVFVRDKDCTANAIYYLNTDYIEMEVLPPPPAFQALIERAGVQADDGFGVLPLGFELQRIAKTGDSDKFSLVTNLQLKVLKPHAFGTRKNVQTT